MCDPRGVHVKYEMLRRVSVEKASVTDVSDEHGVFRLTYYYQAKADFEQAGISACSSRSSEQTGSSRSRRSEAESRLERRSHFTPLAQSHPHQPEPSLGTAIE